MNEFYKVKKNWLLLKIYEISARLLKKKALQSKITKVKWWNL